MSKYPKYDAPIDHIWVCQACGKQSFNQIDGPRGWDEACFMNSYLVRINTDDANKNLPSGQDTTRSC